MKLYVWPALIADMNFITDKYCEHGVWAVRNPAKGSIFI
jgi:hypothetical protein